jgi:DJ-1/PfpI family
MKAAAQDVTTRRDRAQAAHPLNRGRGGGGFVPIDPGDARLLSPRHRPQARRIPVSFHVTLGGCLLGRKRGIFVLAKNATIKDDCAMNTLAPISTPLEITKSRRIGLLVWPGCDVLDVCGPTDVFFYAKYWLVRFGRTCEPGYQCDIVAASPGPVRTTCGIELIATHGYSDIGDGLDTLVVAGGAEAEQASMDPSLVECVRSMAPRVRRVASVCSVHFGGRGPFTSAARDNALVVFRAPREGLSLN